MTHHPLFAGFVFASALALQPAAASAQNTPVQVPSNLTVPEGHVAFLVLAGRQERDRDANREALRRLLPARHAP